MKSILLRKGPCHVAVGPELTRGALETVIPYRDLLQRLPLPLILFFVFLVGVFVYRVVSALAGFWTDDRDEDKKTP